MERLVGTDTCISASDFILPGMPLLTCDVLIKIKDWCTHAMSHQLSTVSDWAWLYYPLQRSSGQTAFNFMCQVAGTYLLICLSFVYQSTELYQSTEGGPKEPSATWLLLKLTGGDFLQDNKKKGYTGLHWWVPCPMNGPKCPIFVPGSW